MCITWPTLESHLAQRKRPRIVISDERKQLLGTGGGVVKALAIWATRLSST